MKVLHLIRGLPKGGAERLCIDICTELNKRNDIEVLLVSMSEENAYSFLTNKIPFIVTSSKVRPAIIGKSIIDTIHFEEIVRDFKPDIIHSHLFRAELLSREVVFNDLNIKYITHCHDNMRELHPFKISSLFNKLKLVFLYEKYWLFKRYKRFDNLFIAISEHTAEFYRKVLPKQVNNVIVLHNGFNYDRFYFSEEKYIKSDKLKLINVGTFAPKKNQQFLIDVAKILKENNINFELHFFGIGECMDKVKLKAQNLGVENYVFFHGNVDNIEEFLWQSDIYVHSAYYEPFGLVLLEAMAAGLPIVCLDGKGNRDIIQNGKNGFIIEKQNPQVFADKIIELAKNPELYHKISEYSKEYAKEFDIKKYVDKLVKIYYEFTGK